MNPEFFLLGADTLSLPFEAFSIPVKKVMASPQNRDEATFNTLLSRRDRFVVPPQDFSHQ
jgi:hypothetical protein